MKAYILSIMLCLMLLTSCRTTSRHGSLQIISIQHDYYHGPL